MEPISVKQKNTTVSDMQEQHDSQGMANFKPEGDNSEGRSNLGVTDIPEAEDSHQNCDSEINKGKILKETTEIDDTTKVRTSTRQRNLPNNKNDDFLEILTNKLMMRDKNKQFVNNECVNSIPLIINSNTISSKNDATLIPNRQNIYADDDDNSSDIKNMNNNHSKLFLPHNSLKVFHQNI
jgi:hypothetical protein